jgi:hypothetical protein
METFGLAGVALNLREAMVLTNVSMVSMGISAESMPGGLVALLFGSSTSIISLSWLPTLAEEPRLPFFLPPVPCRPLL